MIIRFVGTKAKFFFLHFLLRHIIEKNRCCSVLFDFIDSLGEEEKEGAVAVVAATITNSEMSPKPQSEGDDVWLRILDALNNWSYRILDVESRHHRSMSFRDRIEELLNRLQQDGFLSHHDLSELRYIAGLWSNVLNALSCHTIRCMFIKRDIISALLELYILKQITDSLFIDTCLTL